jgi:AraC family transcriptional regulator
MTTTPSSHLLLDRGGVRVVEYRCRADKHTPVVTEMHEGFSISFVRRGSFGYSSARRRHELVAGCLLLGHAGREYVCTHEHVHGGDDCIAFSFAPDVLDDVAGRGFGDVWRAAVVPPTARAMVLGARATAARDANPALLEEIALDFVAHVADVERARTSADAREPTPTERRRAVRAVELIEARHAEPLDLTTIAAASGLGRFHFLRTFARVVGVTPHQYLLRVRVAAAARLLAQRERSITDVAYDAGFGDLSRFVRTFRAAAGASPREFRRMMKERRPPSAPSVASSRPLPSPSPVLSQRARAARPG